MQDLLDVAPDVVVVVGDAPLTGPFDGVLDISGFGLRGAPGPGVDKPALPHALGMGAWFLDQAGWTGVRRYVGVSDQDEPSTCADLGRALAGEGRVALLVCGDGSACRSEKAPGHLDPRAEAFDGAATAALASADRAALLALDPELARTLLFSGRAAWQVLAGALPAGATGSLRHAEAPYGVAYVVASVTP